MSSICLNTLPMPGPHQVALVGLGVVVAPAQPRGLARVELLVHLVHRRGFEVRLVVERVRLHRTIVRGAAGGVNG